MKTPCLALLALSLVASAAACTDNATSKNTLHAPRYQKNEKSENHMTARTEISTPYDHVDVWVIPEVIPFSDEQKAYLEALFSAIRSVMEESSNLEVEEKKIFGEGMFFWPKDPVKPVMVERYYRPDNFRMRGVSLQFKRVGRGAPWTEVEMTVYPRNFPKGAYDMRLPQKFFEEFSLQKVVQENRLEERIENPIVFYFKHKKLSNITLVIESRGDLANVKNAYPASFHVLKMKRESNL